MCVRLLCAQSPGTPTLSKSPVSVTSQPTPATLDPNRTDSGIELWDYNGSLGARSDRHKGSNIPANRDSKGPADRRLLRCFRRNCIPFLRGPTARRAAVHCTTESQQCRPRSLTRNRLYLLFLHESQFRRIPYSHLSAESPASTPPGRGGGAFLTRKPQPSFQSAIQGSYHENSTPPRSSTPSSMTHASTAASSIHSRHSRHLLHLSPSYLS
jgi:hypothetical protein